MDCSAEEQLVRMALDSIEEVSIRRIDLDERTVAIDHPSDVIAIKAALDALSLDTMLLDTQVAEEISSPQDHEKRER